jgi:hypothetical protein
MNSSPAHAAPHARTRAPSPALAAGPHVCVAHRQHCRRWQQRAGRRGRWLLNSSTAAAAAVTAARDTRETAHGDASHASQPYGAVCSRPAAATHGGVLVLALGIHRDHDRLAAKLLLDGFDGRRPVSLLAAVVPAWSSQPSAVSELAGWSIGLVGQCACIAHHCSAISTASEPSETLSAPERKNIEATSGPSRCVSVSQ